MDIGMLEIYDGAVLLEVKLERPGDGKITISATIRDDGWPTAPLSIKHFATVNGLAGRIEYERKADEAGN